MILDTKHSSSITCKNYIYDFFGYLSQEVSPKDNPLESTLPHWGLVVHYVGYCICLYYSHLLIQFEQSWPGTRP
jgi:hypothetical protein